MSEHAYDISHLLESEPAMAAAPVSRIAKAPAAAAPPSVAAEQERLARELLQAAEAHDALIRQYLGMTDDSYRNTYAL
jgi:3-oxoacyl-ACP reductase-like protein